MSITLLLADYPRISVFKSEILLLLVISRILLIEYYFIANLL
jgi:hypothetical protein